MQVGMRISLCLAQIKTPMTLSSRVVLGQCCGVSFQRSSAMHSGGVSDPGYESILHHYYHPGVCRRGGACFRGWVAIIHHAFILTCGCGAFPKVCTLRASTGGLGEAEKSHGGILYWHIPPLRLSAETVECAVVG